MESGSVEKPILCHESIHGNDGMKEIIGPGMAF